MSVANNINLPITIPFNEFINEAKNGGGHYNNIKKSYGQVCRSRFAEYLDNYLHTRDQSHVVWRGEKISTEKSFNGCFLFSDSLHSNLVKYPDDYIQQLKKRLDGDIQAYYAINAAQERLYFANNKGVPACYDFSFNIASGLASSLIDYLKYKLKDQLLDIDDLRFKPEGVLESVFDCDFYGDNACEPSDLINLIDIEKMWAWMNDKVDVQSLNNSRRNIYSYLFMEGFVTKKDYKLHSALKLSERGLCALKNILQDIGLDDGYEFMREVKDRWETKTKVKIYSPIIQKLTLYVNKYAKKELKAALANLERGYL